MRILSISTGKVVAFAAEHHKRGHEVFQSGINKTPVSTLDHPDLVAVGHLGLDGDEQAIKSVHGGPFKAVYAYPVEHYPFWEELTKQQLQHGHLGENLTIEGIVETGVFVGDRWQIGEVELEVTELRTPCFKFNAKMQHKLAAKNMLQHGYSGWYFSVITSGQIKAGDSIKIIPGPGLKSIAQQNADLLSGSKFEF